MTGMRIWPLLLLSLLWASTTDAAPKRKAKAASTKSARKSSSKTAPAEKKSVVLSGPGPLTKFVTRQLSKRYQTRTLKAPVEAQPTAKQVRDVTAPADAVALLVIQPAGQSFIIKVLNGADGTPLDAITVRGTAARPPKAMAKSDLAALLFAVGSGVAPSAATTEPPTQSAEPTKSEPVATKPEPEPAKSEPAKPEPTKSEPVASPTRPSNSSSSAPMEVSQSPATEPTPSTLPALKLSVGGGGFNRALRWAGNPSPYLSTATYPFTAQISVDGVWYPGAHFTSNFLSNLGVFGAADFGMGMVARFNVEGETSRYSASASRLRFGAIVRIPVVERFTAMAHVGYSRHEVTTSDVAVNDGAPRPNIPNVLFNGFRGGLGVRLRLIGTLEFDAGGSFQTVVGKGEIGSDAYFPDTTAFAIDAGGGLSIQLVDHIRLRAGAEWQRYFLTLHPGDDVTYYAQGAVDQYITATASIQWTL